MDKMIHQVADGNNGFKYVPVNTFGTVLLAQSYTEDRLLISYWDVDKNTFSYDDAHHFVPYELWTCSYDDAREAFKKTMIDIDKKRSEAAKRFYD